MIKQIKNARYATDEEEEEDEGNAGDGFDDEKKKKQKKKQKKTSKAIEPGSIALGLFGLQVNMTKCALKMMNLAFKM